MLKSLELFGFKSFADRTQFAFSHGITCVVGPNGSGKSNVVDAMKWILGDQSPKSLRGKEMTDVIFNGSAGRKGSAFAEATLAFDNSKRALPIEADEITVGRRLWRNGDSEYLINGVTSRLKDIRDVFMGTGASTSAYSIIEQGRVGQILQSNPVARRLIFEEAAGISRFKSKKVETFRKLERVSQNLVRLQDIVDQLESQLNSTRSQASKAAKFREVSQELRKVWLGLAGDDYRWFTHQLAIVEEKVNVTNGELAELIESQNEVDRRLASFDSELASVDDQLREAERGAAATRETVVSLEATIRHETSRRRDTESEIARLRRQYSATIARLVQVERECTAAQGELNEFDETYQAQEAAVTEHGRRIEQLALQFQESRDQIEQTGQRRSKLNEEASSIRQQVALLEARLRSSHEARDEAEEELGRLAGESGRANDELAARQKFVEKAEQTHQQILESYSAIRDQKKELTSRQTDTQQRLVELRERRSASQARLAVLEDLEQRQEGVGIGVREILNRARNSDYPPWSHIVGSVADLLDVDLENAALLEVALGAQAQLLVMDDLLPLVEYLNRGGTPIDGRVGFLGLNDDTDAASPEPDRVDLSSDPGVIHRADALVSDSCRYPRLAEQLLADTWIVIDLDSARSLSDGDGRGQRFVTLQGELLEPDGTLYIGSVRGESAVLSRKNELRRLGNDLSRLDQQVKSNEKSVEELTAQIARISDELEETSAKRDQASDALAKSGSERDVRKRIVDRLTEQQQITQKTLDQNTNEGKETQTQLAEAFDSLSQVESGRQAADDELGRLEAGLIEIEQERNGLIQSQTEEKLRLARQSERRESLQSAQKRFREESTAQTDQSEEITRRIIALDERLRTSDLAVLNSSAELAELAIRSEIFAETVRNVGREKKRLRSVRGELVEEETRIRQQRRLISERQHQEEIEIRDIRHRLSTCGERIEEEYGLQLADIVASDVSAFRGFLIERGFLEDPDEESAQIAADENNQQSDATSEDEERGDDSAVAEDVPEELAQEYAEDDDESTDEYEEDDDESADEYAEDDDIESADNIEESSITLQEIQGVRFGDVRDELEERVNRLRRKIKTMGSVNTDSLEALEELEDRFNHFSSQLMDLTEAKATLEDIIRQINVESRRMFLESFEAICAQFRELFRKLFGGGDAEIILEDPDDVLDCGIDIVARPPGKELRSITLLSGGEKTMTAVALLLAIFRSSPSPFCILDEVDAALDDANVERYAGVIHEFKEMTQFIMITHRKRTMTVADVIYGVTMEQSGVSKRLTVSFEDVDDDGEIRTSSARAA